MNRCVTVLIGVALFAVGAFAQESKCPQELLERFAHTYFAPMDGARFSRMYGPLSGSVEFRRTGNSGKMVGAGGYSAEKRGKTVIVHSPSGMDGADVEYRFVNGLPDILKVGKSAYKVVVEDGSVSYAEVVPALWDDPPGTTSDPLEIQWKGRFTLLYRNPNRAGCLMALLAIAFLAMVTSYGSRFWLRIAGVLGAITFVILLFMTESRGSLVAFLAGAAVIGFFAARSRLGRRSGLVMLALCLASVAAIVAALAFAGKFNIWHSGTSGDQLRWEIWSAAPRMMADAPWGWGTVTTPGLAFFRWYQSFQSPFFTWTLVSAHLTAMASFGWAGRLAWVFFWIAVLVIPFLAARRGASALPSALWAAFFVAGLFNPVFSSWTLWLLPLVSLALLGRELRHWKSFMRPLMFCFVLSVAAIVALMWTGKTTSAKADVPVKLVGETVLIGGDSPKVWLLDDEKTLGWVMAPKELRFFYLSVSGTKCLGYAKSLRALPRHVDRLVVAGEKCTEYLEAWKAGKAPTAKSVRFISPPFGPSAIPVDFLHTVPFTMFVGEFALRFQKTYGQGTLPDWVVVVPGAERYIPGWVSLVVTD